MEFEEVKEKKKKITVRTKLDEYLEHTPPHCRGSIETFQTSLQKATLGDRKIGLN